METSKPAAVGTGPASTTPDRNGSLDLRLNVIDPEVVAELLRHLEGEKRDHYALAALRLGVIALRMASGSVDAASVREEGRKLLSDIGILLLERSQETTGKIDSFLTQYFDPKTGSLPQRLESLVKKDGELESLLRVHLGGEDSVLTKTLAAHVGEDSPLFKKLSPDQKDGLLNQLAVTIDNALAEQREKILDQFSQNNKESAISLFLQELKLRQGELGENLQTQIKELVNEFSADHENSALNRLLKMIKEAKERIDANLTLDDESSALARLQKKLVEMISNLQEKSEDFHSKVQITLAELQATRREAERSTRHGVTFQDQFGELLAQEAARREDVYEAVGNIPGNIKHNKKGDFVITLGAENAAKGAKIVWESKADKGYTLRNALDESEEARKNRSAQIGVFVFARKIAPSDIEPFARYGHDLVIIWDPEDVSSDLYVKAAYSVARALIVREGAETSEASKAAIEIDKSARVIERQIEYISDFKTWAGTIESNAGKIIDRAKRMRDDLGRQIESLDSQVAALKSAAPRS